MNATERQPKNKAVLRWMVRRDMDEVLAIERLGFGKDSWTDDDFTKCLRERNNIGLVAEYGEQVVGFIVYSLHKTKLDILNVAVHPDFQRQGVGRQLLQKLQGKLSPQRRTRLTTAIRETNLSAQLWMKDCGFTCVQISKEMYDDTTEDAYLFEYHHCEPQE
jgi:[ribosomal protein S18]-alanine N-acetyltransferase